MKRCCVTGCFNFVDGEISLVFCTEHELAYQEAQDRPIIERPATKKDAGWNVEIFKETK